MTARTRRGAHALIESLAAAGTRRIFTLSGNHIMPVYDAALDARVELIHVRHEAAAVHMADAWARLTGEVGVALVTGGPGHANAVGALYTAAMAEAPVLLLSGHAPASQLGRGAFQEMRQADIAAPLTKASWTARDIPADIAKALAIARAGRPGPVHVSLPVDLLEATAAAPAQAAAQLAAGAQGAAGARFDPAAFLSRLARAQRPLILTGPASLTKPGRARMRELEEATGVPVVGMESPRGIADPGLGAFAQVLKQADCILLLGKRLDFTLKFGNALASDCELMQVDPEEAEIERTRRAVGGRLKEAAIGGWPEIAGTGRPGPWLQRVREHIGYRPAEWPSLPTVRILRALQPLLDSHPDAVFVCDGGEFGQWAQACLTAPNRVINGVAGSIGAALPFALAARLAKPDAPVVAVMGDGTFGFHPAELDTAVRYGLPFVAVVGNDARWNAEYQIQVREYGPGRAVATELVASRYDEVARGFGGYGEAVERPEDLPAALRRAVDSRLPAVLNVTIEGRAAPEISLNA